MSTPSKHIINEEPWRRGAFAHEILPFTADEHESAHIVSDSTKLRIANALQSSLHVRDVIRGFAREVRRMVRGVAVRYRHSVHKVAVDDGLREFNSYTYELTLVGRYLGEITFSRATTLAESELQVLEVLLCTLIYPLRNALQYERALKIALKDPLTGVNNRAMLSAQLKHHISLAQRQLTPLSVLMIDIDHFKSVNDRFGHIVGDVVLIQIANQIVRCTRTSDGVYRYGGEEFVVVLPNTNSAGAELLAERIRGEIQALQVDALPPNVTITASVGVAHYLAGEGMIDLLQRADDLLLIAKRDGRNRVVVAQTTVTSDATSPAALATTG